MGYYSKLFFLLLELKTMNAHLVRHRGVINGKAGKAAALPKFSDMLTLCQSGGADYAQPFGFVSPIIHSYSIML